MHNCGLKHHKAPGQRPFVFELRIHAEVKPILTFATAGESAADAAANGDLSKGPVQLP